MIDGLYTKLWKKIEIRTIILATLLTLMGIMIELYFIFFPLEEIKSVAGVLFIEVDLLGNTLTPILTIFHFIISLLIFFNTITIYALIRDYAGGRTGLVEIGGIAAIYALFSLMIFDMWFMIFFLSGVLLLFLYMYLSLSE